MHVSNVNNGRGTTFLENCVGFFLIVQWETLEDNFRIIHIKMDKPSAAVWAALVWQHHAIAK